MMEIEEKNVLSMISLSIFTVIDLFMLSIFFIGTDVKFNPNPTCFLECKSLTTKDYIDLTWTTFAEFPGNKIQGFYFKYCVIKIVFFNNCGKS